MNNLELKKTRLRRRKNSIKRRLKKTNKTSRLRLCINRSNSNYYAQIIDDVKGHTLLGVSTLAKDFPVSKNRGNVTSAKTLGKIVAEKALGLGIKQVVFDRNGLLYHGKVKAFADAARENGLEF